eukprot:TRINITY_DN11012_c0_g1_i1.p1 TRINITY_DN11012_c0_g1~~TRINITY_DN11012_c0_g1_i1.p1  ORF type:complete len:578 (+),score=94.74 TRINITY_DN11012_c0_g1_i1:353-2086(+)
MSQPKGERVRFKCIFEGDGEKRNLFLPIPIKHQSLLQAIDTLYGRPLQPYYTDEDNDVIRIVSQQDVDHAVEPWKKNGVSIILRLIELEGASPIGTFERPTAPSSLGQPRNRSSKSMSSNRHHLHGPHSPPPGALVAQQPRQRSNSTTSGSSFKDISGGGEFIPEPPEGGMSLRSNKSAYSEGFSSLRSGTSTTSSNTSAPGRLHASRIFDQETESGYFAHTNSHADTVPRARSIRQPIQERQPTTLPRAQTEHHRYALGGERRANMFASGHPRADTGLSFKPDHDMDSDVREKFRTLSTRDSAAVSMMPSPGRWRRGKLLGSGAFGQVYTAMNIDTGSELAVKQVDLHPESGKGSGKEVSALQDEIQLLKNLRHERIVMYYGTEKDAHHLCIFMEYVPGRSIANRLHEYGPFTVDVVRKYTRQILEGLHYLHEHRIVHRDIKGANVLATANGDVKLADFGASKRLQEIKTMTGFKSMHGTPNWMAPEVVTGAGYGRRSDIWSVGCTVIEMLTTHPPLYDCEPMAALFKIGSPSVDFTDYIPDGASQDCNHFLMLAFRRDRTARPAAEQLLQHEFVA